MRPTKETQPPINPHFHSNFVDRFLLMFAHCSISPLIEAHMYCRNVILISKHILLTQSILITGYLYLLLATMIH